MTLLSQNRTFTRTAMLMPLDTMGCYATAAPLIASGDRAPFGAAASDNWDAGGWGAASHVYFDATGREVLFRMIAATLFIAQSPHPDGGFALAFADFSRERRVTLFLPNFLNDEARGYLGALAAAHTVKLYKAAAGFWLMGRPDRCLRFLAEHERDMIMPVAQYRRDLPELAV